MRRLAFIALSLLAAGAAFASTATGGNERTYFIELDNAFGLVTGSEVKVAGVEQGTIKELHINKDRRAVIEVELTGDLSQLGEDTICSSEPQSLIAEYFIDCIPKGPPLEEGTGSLDERIESADIPVDQTRQTVQNDLVQSGLRQSYKERLSLIINEFGTALAGNPENLNSAIRRGAPALGQAKRVTKILADQNRIIRDLNENSDTVLAELSDKREDVRKFVINARATGEASAAVRDSLSANFRDLDDFLAELNPTAVALNEFAVTQTPLLRDLRRAGPGLADLSRDLPDFNRAGTTSIKSLADASKVGTRALRKSRNEIDTLRVSTKKSFSVADKLSKFLRDIDDPDRAVEQDKRSEIDTGRKGGGYTGMEGLLNYVYYQTGALNQFDEVSHLLHFSIFEIGEGPCASYNPEDTVPAADGGETTNILEADPCVAWLGKNQPGISQDIPLKPYDPSVCPEGSTDLELCDPNGASTTSKRQRGFEKQSSAATGARGNGNGNGGNGTPDLGDLGGAGNGGGNGGGDSSGPRGALPGGLGDSLGLPDLGSSVRKGLQRGSASGAGGSNGSSTTDLFGFLFGN